MYVVTGFILIVLFSRQVEACVRSKVRAKDSDQARDRALAIHREAAEAHDPQATVIWQERPTVKIIGGE